MGRNPEEKPWGETLIVGPFEIRLKSPLESPLNDLLGVRKIPAPCANVAATHSFKRDLLAKPLLVMDRA